MALLPKAEILGNKFYKIMNIGELDNKENFVRTIFVYARIEHVIYEPKFNCSLTSMN